MLSRKTFLTMRESLQTVDTRPITKEERDIINTFSNLELQHFVRGFIPSINISRAAIDLL